MADLTVSTQEQMEYRRENEWRRAGVSEMDIAFSRLSGMDARDVQTFREISSQYGLLIVVRCPKVAARAWHGLVPPKPWAMKQKTGTSGLAVGESGEIRVSDYDLMSIWRKGADGFEKLFMSAAGGAPRGRWTQEAQVLAVELNRRLVSRIQHGCQDDFESPKNPGVKSSDHFAAFRLGQAVHLADPSLCARYYAQAGLHWPYDADGHFAGNG
ncbi:MAG TPA: hypothetical protein PKY50_09640 [Candidatus Competibacter sp.]|nr:hypothetical protein [Candidatus Competibacter sp.]